MHLPTTKKVIPAGVRHKENVISMGRRAKLYFRFQIILMG